MLDVIKFVKIDIFDIFDGIVWWYNQVLNQWLKFFSLFLKFSASAQNQAQAQATGMMGGMGGMSNMMGGGMGGMGMGGMGMGGMGMGGAQGQGMMG